MAGKLITDYIQTESGTLAIQNITGSTIFTANAAGFYTSTGALVIAASGTGAGNFGSVTANTGNFGSVTANNGLYSSNNFTGTYTDGIVVDYVTGNGRISVGTNDGITFYSGGVANTQLANISSSGTLSLNYDYKESTYTANANTSFTVNTSNGTIQILTLVGNCSFTFPTPTAGKSFTIILYQDATGSRSVTWPVYTTLKWPSNTAPTITSTASKSDKFVFTSDGNYWYGTNTGQNY